MNQNIGLKTILDFVAAEFELAVDEIVKPSTSNVLPRQIYAYFAKRFTQKSNVEISSFVCRNHSLAATAITKITTKMQWDKTVAARVDKFEQHFIGAENAEN